MSVVLVTTAKSPSANSYVTLAEVSAYAETTIWSDVWATIADGDEDVANGLIVRGTRYLDWLTFSGRQTDPVQRLQHPRVGVYLLNGTMLDCDVVSQYVKDACAHLIAYLASFGLAVDPFVVDPTAKIVRKTVGPLSTDYVQSMGPDGVRILNTVIAPLLSPFGLLAPQGSVRLTR